MSEEQSSPDQNAVETKPATPVPSQNSFNLKSNLLLFASLMILLGFFLPWISIGGYQDYDRHNSIPVINGTFLLSNTSEIPGYSWLALLFLFSILIGSAVVAYNSYQKSQAPIKTIIIAISLATFIPVLVFFLNLSASTTQELRALGYGEEFSLGAGMIMMIAGSAYCLFFVTSEVTKNNRLINYRNLIKHGAIGGVATACALFMLLKFANGSLGWMVFLYLAIFAIGIIVTNNVHAQSNGRTNYGRIITLGFIISVFTVIIQYILSNIFYSKEISQIPMQGNLLFVALILHVQLGLIITSISSTLTSMAYTAPLVPPVVDASRQPVQQVGGTQTSSEVIGPPFDLKKFMAKNRYIIISLAGLTFLVIGVYYIFLKHYPVKDAKKAATAYCDCGKNQNKQTKDAYKKFINDFESSKYSGREEAQQKLSALIQSVTDISQKCNIAYQEKLTKLGSRYVGDREKSEKFNYAYSIQMTLCNNSDNEVGSLYNQAANKINEYVGPVEIEQRRQDSIAVVQAQLAEQQAALAFDNATKTPPTTEKMKQDIRGKTFPLPYNELGWSGVQYSGDENFLSFKSSEIFFQKETSSFTSKIDMLTQDKNKIHYNLIGIITYTWDFNTNTWNFQNIVVEEFKKIN